MLKAVRLFFQSDNKTKSFILTWVVYGLVILVSTIYCYARLDSVRSGPKAASENERSQ